jgi:hypothetical protein
MKNLNLTSQVNQTETNENLNSDHLEFNEVVVYKEMADQPAVRMNLIQQIHAQMNQLDEMLDRKQFVLKEIYSEIVK